MTGHLGPSLGALGTIPHRTRTHTHRCRHPGVCQLHDSADFGVDLTGHSWMPRAGPSSLRWALMLARRCNWPPSRH